MTTQTIVTAALVVLLLVFLVQTLRDKVQPPPAETGQKGGDQTAADDTPHLLMGNPSGATSDHAKPDNYLLKKPYFATSFNNQTGTPNWVSWCLKESDLGPAPRAEFYPDKDLPLGFKRVIPRDYASTGFDRGHMCPRSDRTSTPEAANATFVMTNILPQSPHLNQRGWADLEDYCRSLVKENKRTLYIVAGPQGRGGAGTNGPAETIAGGKVTVPAKCWKVVLAVENGTGNSDDVSRVVPTTRAIAVVMPNDQTIGHDWPKYRTSVKAVEELTGYRFFDRVPSQVIDPVKAKVDDAPVRAGGHSTSRD